MKPWSSLITLGGASGELGALEAGATTPGERFGSVSRTTQEPAGHGVAHLALHNTNLSPLVVGPAVSVAGRHANVRRDGYRRQ